MKKVLILRAGTVARPADGYHLEKEGVEVVVANRNPEKAKALVAGHPGGRAVALDVEDAPMLKRTIAAADIVVSLLPWTLHSVIAELCLAHGKHMVTSYYVK